MYNNQTNLLEESLYKHMDKVVVDNIESYLWNQICYTFDGLRDLTIVQVGLNLKVNLRNSLDKSREKVEN